MTSHLAIACGLAFGFLVLAGGDQAHASDCVRNQEGNVVCGEGPCAVDQYGKVFCAKAGGGAVRDQYGTVKCGVGNCAKDDHGRLRCSTRPGGGARMDAYGKVKCLGGCQDARAQLCESPR